MLILFIDTEGTAEGSRQIADLLAMVTNRGSERPIVPAAQVDYGPAPYIQGVQIPQPLSEPTDALIYPQLPPVAPAPQLGVAPAPIPQQVVAQMPPEAQAALQQIMGAMAANVPGGGVGMDPAAARALMAQRAAGLQQMPQEPAMFNPEPANGQMQQPLGGSFGG